jgi:hydrogenase maturation protein HypF
MADLPSRAPAFVLEHLAWPLPTDVVACGAFLKNSACRVAGSTVRVSPEHGDLSTAAACAALADSLQWLAGGHRPPGRLMPQAFAHDLHPDFHSTRLALQWAAQLQVPALGVQHHHAHVAAIQAEHGLDPRRPLVGLALDGVGLGTDGHAWGGEVLVLPTASRFERVAHLPWLALPGGDVAAREPWRLAAAALHAAGHAARVGPLLAPRVGAALAQGVAAMLARGLNCPPSSAAGRWFDAAAGALGLSDRQAHEAEAAMALERAAAQALAERGLRYRADDARRLLATCGDDPDAGLDLLPLVVALFDERDVPRGAARFHARLALALVQAAQAAAHAAGTRDVALGGGCFFNRILRETVTDGLQAAGLRVWSARSLSFGDGGLALGQAWVAAHALAEAPCPPPRLHPAPPSTTPCPRLETRGRRIAEET